MSFSYSADVFGTGLTSGRLNSERRHAEHLESPAAFVMQDHTLSYAGAGEGLPGGAPCCFIDHNSYQDPEPDAVPGPKLDPQSDPDLDPDPNPRP